MVDPQSYANGGPPPGGVVQASQGPSNKIQIFISCRKLKDLDILSKSDPVCVMFLKDSKSNSWQRLGETEMMLNNLNPDFTKSFTIDYYFEKQQDIKFELYDVDPNGRTLDAWPLKKQRQNHCERRLSCIFKQRATL